MSDLVKVQQFMTWAEEKGAFVKADIYAQHPNDSNKRLQFVNSQFRVITSEPARKGPLADTPALALAAYSEMVEEEVTALSTEHQNTVDSLRWAP